MRLMSTKGCSMFGRVVVWCGLAVGAALVWGSVASAHVVIESQDRTAAAVFHVTPDDSPIAGKSSALFFDVRSQQASQQEMVSAELKVFHSDAEMVRVSARVDRGAVHVDYTFAVQGAYRLQLSVQYEDVVETFETVQRVSRGGAAAPAEESSVRYRGAELLLVVSVVATAVIVATVVTRRREILAASQ